MSAERSDAERRSAVAERVREIQTCWIEGRPAEIARCVRADAVMSVPAVGVRVEGRDAFVATFVDYCATCETLSFEETEMQVDLFGATAIASFQFEVVYERDGEEFHSTGTDVWMLVEENGEWLVAWRAMADVEEGCAAEE